VVLGSLVLGALAAAALPRWMPPPPAPPAPVAVARVEPFPGGPDAPSSIMPEDVVGPDACKSCHRKNYDKWLKHPHRRMNQLATDDTVLADFESRTVEHQGGTARFEHPSKDVFLMTIDFAKAPRRVYRITRVIGVRLRQFYVGVLVEGVPGRLNVPDDEVVTPFGWWVIDERWAPMNYFWPYGDDLPEGGATEFGPWPKDMPIRKACYQCHNTTAYLHRLGSSNADDMGFAAKDVVRDEQALDAEIRARSVGSGAPASGPGSQLDRNILHVGITCENCHFGARAHAEEDHEYQFGPSSPHLALRPADASQTAERSKDNPWLVNGICRQCHNSTGVLYPDGTALGNSLEATEQDASACASKMSCTSCHDPHEAGPADEGGPDDPRHLDACIDCHAGFAAGAGRQVHSKHLLESANCLDCHMPRTNVGITHAVRTHRISIPGDPRVMAVGGPNACNLCHADRSIAWTVEQLNTLWDRRIEPAAGWAAAWGGSLDTPAIEAWTVTDSQHVQMVLTEVLARRSDRDSFDRLLTLVEDPCGAVRAFALNAIERRVGRRIPPEELDVAALPAPRAAQLAKLRPTLWASQAGAASP
jgi:hypothetical protein